MATIRISEETMRRSGGGDLAVEVGGEVAARLEAAPPGETPDNTIQRIIRQHLGERSN